MGVRRGSQGKRCGAGGCKAAAVRLRLWLATAAVGVAKQGTFGRQPASADPVQPSRPKPASQPVDQALLHHALDKLLCISIGIQAGTTLKIHLSGATSGHHTLQHKRRLVVGRWVGAARGPGPRP